MRELVTERLVLRPHVASDFEDCFEMWSEQAVSRYIGGKPSDRFQTWARVLRYAGLWSLLGYGYWAIRHRDTGEFIGEVGLADFKRGLNGMPELPEAGWALRSKYWGRGYSREALAAMLQWADTCEVTHATTCIIHPENTASLRVALDLGYQEYGRVQRECEPLIVFTRFGSQRPPHEKSD